MHVGHANLASFSQSSEAHIVVATFFSALSLSAEEKDDISTQIVSKAVGGKIALIACDLDFLFSFA